MKTNIGSVLMIVALSCVAADAPNAHAVVPPPDGGYPNFTTAEGTNALKNLTTSAANTAVGWFSLFGDTTASFNTGVGAGTLLFNNGDQNTAVGAVALLNNTTGSFNTATGVSALSSNTTGVSNNAFGWGALLSNTTGTNNTAIGVRALQSNTEGVSNVAVGEIALSANTTGSNNTAIGFNALSNNTIRSNNTALGEGAGSFLQGAGGNVCIGQGVTGAFTDGNITRIRNIGTVAFGGATNVVIGSIGGIGDGILGYNGFSLRHHEDIQPLDKASETLFALKPVSFRGKNNMGAANVKLYGLIAEDVATVDPDLVVFNSEGQPETLRLDSINAMLLNEFLKEHRKVQKLEAALEAITARLNKQESELQKVSARVAVRKAARQIASKD